MTASIHDRLESVIDAEIAKAERSEWGGARFRMRRIEIDSRGDVGELFLRDVLVDLGHKVEMDRTTDSANKHWDLKVDGDICLEVKTASKGANDIFQHEKIFRQRRFDALVLVDIAPNDVYLTMAPKHTLPFKKPNSNWSVNNKKLHHRKPTGDYKWDLSLKDVADRRVETHDDVAQMYADMAASINAHRKSWRLGALLNR